MSFPFSSHDPIVPVSFSTFPLHPDLQRGIAACEFTTPTPIQQSAMPPGLLGKDVLACAMTGSGKTAAFALPIMNRILEAKKTGRDGITRALVLSPTRELAAQIRDHIVELGRFTTIRCAAIFGGVGMEPQVTAFKRGVDILIATPGRLLDHFSYPYAKLNDLEFLVLDEADRMLDMGFLPDVRKVLHHLPRKPRQTLFFSATMPEPIVVLTREMLKNPVAINIERPSAPAEGVTQTAYPVPEALKSKLLLNILRKDIVRTAIAFTRTKHRANRLADFLTRNGISCACIHGNRSQMQRTAALSDFKKGKSRILVATDIAARGIDVEALSHVINFDVPHIADDYIHRVGRTARAELAGDAFTFISPAEEIDFRMIERQLKTKIPRMIVEDFDYKDHTSEQLEIPLGQRIAAIRAKKSEDRARAAAKASRKAPSAGAAPHASSNAGRTSTRTSAPRHSSGNASSGSQETRGSARPRTGEASRQPGQRTQGNPDSTTSRRAPAANSQNSEPRRQSTAPSPQKPAQANPQSRRPQTTRPQSTRKPSPRLFDPKTMDGPFSNFFED